MSYSQTTGMQMEGILGGWGLFLAGPGILLLFLFLMLWLLYRIIDYPLSSKK